jgi:hypothetical protein
MGNIGDFGYSVPSISAVADAGESVDNAEVVWQS